MTFPRKFLEIYQECSAPSSHTIKQTQFVSFTLHFKTVPH